MSISSSPRISLITGASGQDGTYLSHILEEAGHTVHRLTRQTFHENSKANWYTVDYSDWQSISDLLESIHPDEIYHLASPSCLEDSWEFEREVIQMGITLTHQILRWICERSASTRFFLASSSEVFGIAEKSPQNERTPFNPQHPYAFAKSGGAQFVRYFRENKGVFACSGILFNHESPLRRTEFVTRHISAGVAAIVMGKKDTLRLGNLAAVRDWSHAKDFAHATRLILNGKSADDYILASGKGHTVEDFCRVAFSSVDLDYRKFVETDPRRVRIDRGAARIGDPSQARKILGWQPQYSFEDVVKEMVISDLELLQQR